MFGGTMGGEWRKNGAALGIQDRAGQQTADGTPRLTRSSSVLKHLPLSRARGQERAHVAQTNEGNRRIGSDPTEEDRSEPPNPAHYSHDIHVLAESRAGST